MKKTSVYLSESDVARLAYLAEREGVSQAEVIRKAISAYATAGGADRDFRLLASGDGPGDSVADYDENALFAGFGE